ncbi:MAG: ricin-type beta-trefoil lectin domain protein [Steroidobacteraceae bacterium]
MKATRWLAAPLDDARGHRAAVTRASRLVGLSITALAAAGCTSTYVVPPDPIPVLGAQILSSAGGCVDVRDGVTADGTPIVLFQCHGSPNQRWFIGRGEIAENFGSCLDVQGSAAVDGAAIILVTCNGRPSQQWRVIDGQIVGLGNKCLDSKDGGAADLTPLILSECRPTPGQRWTIQ